MRRQAEPIFRAGFELYGVKEIRGQSFLPQSQHLGYALRSVQNSGGGGGQQSGGGVSKRCKIMHRIPGSKGRVLCSMGAPTVARLCTV